MRITVNHSNEPKSGRVASRKDAQIVILRWRMRCVVWATATKSSTVTEQQSQQRQATKKNTIVDLAWVLNTIFSRFNLYYRKCKRPSLFIVAYFIHTFASEFVFFFSCILCTCDLLLVCICEHGLHDFNLLFVFILPHSRLYLSSITLFISCFFFSVVLPFSFLLYFFVNRVFSFQFETLSIRFCRNFLLVKSKAEPKVTENIWQIWAKNYINSLFIEWKMELKTFFA